MNRKFALVMQGHLGSIFKTAVIGIAILAMPLFLCFGTMLETSMSLIGLRSDGRPIRVSETNFAQIRAVSDHLGIALRGCHITGSDSRIVQDVDILWGGVGDKAYVAIGEQGQSASPYARFAVNNQGLDPIATNGWFDPCFDLQTDGLFDSDQGQLSPHGAPLLLSLKAQLQEFAQQKVAITAVSVVVHTDSVQAVNPVTEKLSLQRAQAVSAWLEKELALKKGQLSVYAADATQPVVACGKDLSDSALKQCDAPNRRVEVHVTLGATS